MQCASRCISNDDCLAFAYQTSSQVCEFGIREATIPSLNSENSKVIFARPGSGWLIWYFFPLAN